MTWPSIVSGSGLQNKSGSIMSPLQTNLLNATSCAFPVMSVDSANWMAKKLAI
jgi:hypothetical protein